MGPYDTKISIDKVLLQEKKWLDAINTASVTVKDKDPVSASCVAWVISNGYVPRISDHECQKEDLSSPIHGKREISTKQPSTGKRWDYRGTTPSILIAP